MHELELTGCTPEPLMSYLKALGVFRLVSEQADETARACWREGCFCLMSQHDAGTLVTFFLHEYEPTPIVAPWAGGCGFFQLTPGKVTETMARFFFHHFVAAPISLSSDESAETALRTDHKAVKALAQSGNPRLGRYGNVIQRVRETLENILPGVSPSSPKVIENAKQISKEVISTDPSAFDSMADLIRHVLPSIPQEIGRALPVMLERLEKALRSVDGWNEQQRNDLIRSFNAILRSIGKNSKLSGETKERVIRRFRNELPEAVVQWMDAAMVIQTAGQAFPPILGTGGNDGRLDFTLNFMERLVALGLDRQTPVARAEDWLRQALFGELTVELPAASVGQFAPGRAGGPNATQGTEGSPLDNPWDFVFMMEGALLLSGAVSRRLGCAQRDKAAFPFTVRPAAVGFESPSDSDSSSSRGETWLPLWANWTTQNELKQLFAEGRAELGRRQARDGLEFAQALAALGVDRGIRSFARYGFLKRSGKAYLAAALGRVDVRAAKHVHLLRQADAWLDRFRRAGRAKDAPARFAPVARGIESAIFDYCRYSGPVAFAAIVAALGRAERELSLKPEWAQGKYVPPLAGLRSEWLGAADDGSVEFEIARGLASIYDAENKIGPVRSNLELVVTRYSRDRREYAQWAEKDRCVAWNAGSLSANLASVLVRRVMDGRRAGCEHLPLQHHFAVSRDALAAYLAGDVDEQRIEHLLWGLAAVQMPRASLPPRRPRADAGPLPRAYALLKLLFLPRPLRIGDMDYPIPPEPGTLPLLEAGRVGQACRLAARRLSGAGLFPLPQRVSGGSARDACWAELDGQRALGQRVAAALLLPLSEPDIQSLCHLVLRPQDAMSNLT